MAPPARGRRPAFVTCAVVRELISADIQKLQDLKPGDLGTGAQIVKKLRHSHHGLAKLLTDGVKEAECSVITGYSGPYISIIKHDPAFAELIAHYQSEKHEIYLDVHQRLSSVALDAVEEIQERLADEPENITMRELKEIVEMGMDRSGFGPTSSVKHSGAIALVDASTIQQIKDDVKSRQLGGLRPLLAPPSQRTEMGSSVIEGTLAETTEPARGEGQRTDIPAESPEKTPG